MTYLLTSLIKTIRQILPLNETDITLIGTLATRHGRLTYLKEKYAHPDYTDSSLNEALR